MSDDVSTITFRLPASLREKIKEQAKAEERSEGAFIRYHLAQLLAVADEDTGDEDSEPAADQ
jgi:Arc/MetJ-type ribon-helix-helix transcriptional regulator